MATNERNHQRLKNRPSTKRLDGSAISNWHFLVFRRSEGMLDDFEYWLEEVRFYGNGRWCIRARGVTEDRSPVGKAIYERFSTRALIDWLLEWDWADAETVIALKTTCKSSKKLKTEIGRTLGPRGSVILRVAKSLQAMKCQRQLTAWVDGRWPASPKPPKVIEITGTTEIRKHRSDPGCVTYTAYTTEGFAYLHPITKTTADVQLFGSQPSDHSWTVKLSKQAIEQLASFKAEYDSKWLNLRKLR